METVTKSLCDGISIMNNLQQIISSLKLKSVIFPLQIFELKWWPKMYLWWIFCDGISITDNIHTKKLVGAKNNC